ncbi:MAG TPA: hypothetical protein VFG63_07330 [Nocardioidaceae bacterium]|nr:hypothetical protein [Nocardioidaceae bacterium]
MALLLVALNLRISVTAVSPVLDQLRADLDLSRGAAAAPLVRFHHRLKTHGRWRLRQPEPGTYLWRSPHGWYWRAVATDIRDANAAG